MNSLGIYIHIPYCLQKCNYCDFYSIVNKDSINEYIDKLLKEIEDNGLIYSKSFVIDTIFFGGGTPSVLNQGQLGRIIDCIKNKFTLAKDAEISIEANPETITKEKANDILSLGFNRVSMGVQSLNDDILKKLGRVHSSKKAIDSYFLLREAGFNNINLDLMLGVPNQTFEIFTKDFDKVLLLDPEHISFYSLQLEEGTKMYEDYNNYLIDIPSWDENRRMYHYAKEKLKVNNYHHYEISNASKFGFECKHNLKYWTQKQYLGIGSSAHSYIGNTRFFNTSSINYERKIDIVEDQNDILSDKIFTGLRLIDGYDFGIEFVESKKLVIHELISDGYLQKENTRLFFTDIGLDNTNYVLRRLING